MKRFGIFLLVIALCVPCFAAQTLEGIAHSAGNRIDYTPGSAVSAGEIITLGTSSKFAGIATSAIAADAKGSLAIEGVFKIKKGAIAFAVGAGVEWNESGSTAAVAGSGYLTLGTCILAAVSGDDFVLCKLSKDVDFVDGTLIYVSPEGDNGNAGGVSSPVKTVAGAFALVTATRKRVILAPGYYTSAAAIVWPAGVSEVLLTGVSGDAEATVIHCSAGNEVIDIDPNSTIGAANVLCFLSNLCISADDGIDGVTIDNTDMATSKKLIVTFRNCSFESDDDTTEKSIQWVHGAADAPIKMYMHGTGLGGNNMEAPMAIVPGHASDRCKVNGMNLEGGMSFGTANVASEHEFYSCIVKDAGGSGGHDNQILRASGCVSRDGTTHAAVALGDFAANAEEAFLNY